MLQLAKNPPIAYSATANAERLDGVDWATPWTAAYCKPRQEKALAWDLRRRGHTYFLPMVLRETSSGGRRRRNYYPLFASYLFLTADEATRLTALKTDRVLRFVDISAAQQDQFRRELAALAAAIHVAPESIELYAHLAVGTPVRVKAGPLQGVEGVVVQHEQRHKLWLGVSALGVGATIEIHPDLVEPC
jgi:transcription termination/antitermination protein NusG